MRCFCVGGVVMMEWFERRLPVRHTQMADPKIHYPTKHKYIPTHRPTATPSATGGTTPTTSAGPTAAPGSCSRSLTRTRWCPRPSPPSRWGASGRRSTTSGRGASPRATTPRDPTR